MTTNTLILDYSWSGTTAKMAAQLQAVTGADRQSVTVAPGTFPADMYATSDVANDQLKRGALPALTNSLPDLQGYQTLLVGGPVWSGDVATPVRTLLGQLTGFTGTVAPFYTDAGTAGAYETHFDQLLTTAHPAPGLELTAGDLRNAVTATATLADWWQAVQAAR